jgi:uncharacterized repeat protein (TIGR03987 family)
MLLLFAIISVFLALIFYATSIYKEFREKKLSIKALAFLWLGFVFDLTGTILMSLIAKGFSLNFHSIAGLTVLALMGVKAAWSSVNYRQGAEKRVPVFYTLISSLVWLAVFIAGFFIHR